MLFKVMADNKLGDIDIRTAGLKANILGGLKKDVVQTNWQDW